MEYYAFTIKYNPTVDDDELRYQMNELITFWKKNGVQVHSFIYEDKDKRGQPTKLHAHGTISIKRGLYRRKLMLPRFHVKLVSWHSNNWEEYCKKNLVVNLFDIPVQKCSEVPSRCESPHLEAPKRSLFSKSI